MGGSLTHDHVILTTLFLYYSPLVLADISKHFYIFEILECIYLIVFFIGYINILPIILTIFVIKTV